MPRLDRTEEHHDRETHNTTHSPRPSNTPNNTPNERKQLPVSWKHSFLPPVPATHPSALLSSLPFSPCPSTLPPSPYALTCPPQVVPSLPTSPPSCGKCPYTQAEPPSVSPCLSLGFPYPVNSRLFTQPSVVVPTRLFPRVPRPPCHVSNYRVHSRSSNLLKQGFYIRLAPLIVVLRRGLCWLAPSSYLVLNRYVCLCA